MNKGIVASALGLLAVMGAFGGNYLATASDHDDGVSSSKTKPVNLTDLFVFREDNQTGNAADRGNLVLIMNSHPHTPAGEQGVFSTRAQYNFHLTRVPAAGENVAPTAAEDIVLRFSFSAPDANQRQAMTMKMVRDGQEITATPVSGNGEVLTSSLADGKAGTIKTNRLWLNDTEVSVFAGMREDPFFFDFEQFVKVRAGAADLGPKVGFLPAAQAVDYFRGENINSIIVRIPIALLQSDANEPIFDVWETVSLTN